MEVSWDQSHRPERLENLDFIRSVERKPFKWLPIRMVSHGKSTHILYSSGCGMEKHGRGRVEAWKPVRKLFSGPGKV